MKILSALITAALTTLALGQATSDLLTTMGTTAQSGGNDYAYILWQPGDPSKTLGTRVAIYSKPGGASSLSPFEKHGVQSLQTSANTIRAMLELGLKVDAYGPQMVERIDGIYQDVIFNTGEAPSSSTDTLDSADKLFFLIQSAIKDPRSLARLFMLGRSHPGVMQALGHAYLQPIDATGVRTFEIREIDNAGADVRVLGRVTLDPENPLELDAPGIPIQVLHEVHAESQYPINPKDHLNVRLRWGVESPLREKMAHTFGFDLFRVKKADAEAFGWDASPPTPEQMRSALATMLPTDTDPAVAQVNELPILPETLLTMAEALNIGDSKSLYTSNDGVRYRGGDGKNVRRPFSDGEAFYYFAAARDILGRSGQLSLGSLVTMCDRQPPSPPSIQAVTGIYQRPLNQAQREAQNFPQFLQVKIRQLRERSGAELPDSAAPSGYHVYRWSRPDEYLETPGNPAFQRIGYIAHQAGDAFVSFNDNGVGAPTPATHLDRSVWYTVRAVGKSACSGEVLSGHSSPIAGFLRDFKAPGGPTGSVVICQIEPTATFKSRAAKNPADFDLPPDYEGIAVRVQRVTPNIRSAMIEVALRRADQSWLIVHEREVMYQNGNLITEILPFPEPVGKQGALRVRVKGTAITGEQSNWAQHVYDGSAQPFAQYDFEVSARMECKEHTDFPQPFHFGTNLDGTVNIINGTLLLPVGENVHEWRIYRRVGRDGPLTLVKKGEGLDLPLAVAWEDDALPSASGAIVCYYGQVFDQNANPSPLRPLGCVTMVSPLLPTPMLAPITRVTDDGTTATLRLDWFCDPAGVERFEIFAADQNGEPFDVGGLSSRLQEIPLVGMAADFPDLGFDLYQTTRLQGALGSGPSFTVNVTVPAEKTLFFAVRACGPGEFPARTSGSLSNVATSASEVASTTPQPIIPWPARPLPGVFDHRREIESYVQGEGPFWPVVMPTSYASAATGILIGLSDFQIEPLKNNRDAIQAFTSDTPESWLFQVRSTSGDMSSLEPLMPFMLYRHQMPSTQHPSARANLVQCTPMIDRISWKKLSTRYEVRDPYLTFQPLAGGPPVIFPIPISGAWDDLNTPLTGNPDVGGAPRPRYLDDATGLIFLKDVLPVIAGAKYRHIIVCFDEDREIRRVIPLNPVQH